MAVSRSLALPALRRAVAAREPGAAPGKTTLFGLGMPALDAWLGGGLARGGLHEVHAGHARQPAASVGFGLGLALRASGRNPLVWVRQDLSESETGRIHGDGLVAFGLDPARLVVVRAGNPAGVLRAAAEAGRCPALGAALVEIWGMPQVLDLTASRRLALAARASGVTLVMIRLGTPPVPSAAVTRWRVEAASSAPLEANAPGRPAFAAALLRHRSGIGPRTWRMEWDRDSAAFAAPSLPRPVVPLPSHRSAAEDERVPRRRAG